MSSNANVANAVGAKTARACDSCIKKRARWYCAADDAFLCQACNASVHSANPLARRHERVRLKTASFGSSNTDSFHMPSWHRRFTRKARTPRRKGKRQPLGDNDPTLPLVPEVGVDEILHEINEEEDHLLYNYRVPVYDPFVGELYTSAANSNEETANNNKGQESGPSEEGPCCNRDDVVDSCLHGFLPSEMDFAEFAADVESLLGRGLENESRAMEELGLVDYSCREKDFSVKVEEDTYLVGDDDDECKLFDSKFSHEDTDLEREPYELNFDYDGDDSPAAASTCEDDYQKIIKMDGNDEDDDPKENVNRKKRKILLRLDYEAVSSAWRATTEGSPWTDGGRPDFDPDQCWPDCMGYGTRGFEGHSYPHQVYGELAGLSGHPAAVDGGREARVSRYREKRRRRLFSKKIRYEVRKLNAEKRPRMKGRFVKRASSLTSGLPSPAFAVFNKSTN